MSTATYLILGLIASAATFGGFASWLASQKNRSAEGWLLLGLFFTLPAMIALAAAPTIPGSNGEWICPQCAEVNDAGTFICKDCRQRRS